ncbi:hypothetical protein I2F27_12050 [Acinetobacter sp. B5B]|uniref:hypothetical protein n=1 Tax=Acinetobacter baretiae TaxID=2605383 RepID=UPI0018C31812|nr:hypothetical protein [Acinetobacter baretiae]MBF7684020.1 hypothetical protein [Acinetobacter baretiae]MBF7684030.1 hypothetical protein [Acinetobacter baretiae]
MSLNHFPKEAEKRHTIWCLTESDIRDALKSEDGRVFLNTENLTIVQIPVTNIAKFRSPELAKLEKSSPELFQSGNILVIDNENISSPEKRYLEVNDAIEDFLQSNLKRANLYARILSVLGATSFSFQHTNRDDSETKIHAEANVEGLSGKITNANAEVTANCIKTLNEFAFISKRYTQTTDKSLEERLRIAKAIMVENSLQNDNFIKDCISGLEDGCSELKCFEYAFTSKSTDSKSLKALINMQVKIPLIESTSLASFKSKFDLLSLVKKDFEFKMIVNFEHD